MGTSYSVLTINDETRNWLREMDLDLSEVGAESRYPTILELRKTIDALVEHTVEYTISPVTWQANVTNTEGEWASLVLLDYESSDKDEDIPHRFYFEKGWENVIREILQALATICGSLVYFSNAEMDAKLILPENN